MWSRALLRSARSPAFTRTALRTPAASRITVPSSSLWMRGLADKRSPKPSNSSQQPTDPQSTSKPLTDGPDPLEAESAPKLQDAPSSETTEPQKPFNLPDLTQGIPSTLEFEKAGATNKSALQELEEEPATSGGRGKGELPASAYVSSTDRRRNQMANYAYGAALFLAVASVAFLGRDWDEEEAPAHQDIPNGWYPGLWWKRFRARTGDTLSYYNEPTFEKLLPDPDPMFERPYTLCISLEDMLVHSEWTREHGWRIAKRPGADYFLHYLSQYYELVLFTTVPFAMGEPLVRKMDPFRFIVWPLFREATKYEDGEIVKDLSYLNRDLSKVVIVDTNARHVRNQPENAIVLPKWTGDPKDKELVSLIPFLEYVHTMQYKDVREVLKSFDGKHIPTEFQRREAIARAQFEKEFQARKPKHKSGMASLGSMLGLKPSNMSMMVVPEGEVNPSEAFAQGKMLQDIARERGQRNYEMMEEEIRKNGKKWLEEEQQMQEKAQAEAMASMKGSLTGWFLPTGGEKK
ncbi:Mitochondrial import inner membrane translocase subunit TIM50 [Apiospora hydei]|uniref:Mitochondrial import inner membrane translocase subunit TIM50 n=1 Tax=Apiospora hydei TaxID=1337664 RepID=A0ABR1V3W9_9PEZI